MPALRSAARFILADNGPASSPGPDEGSPTDTPPRSRRRSSRRAVLLLPIVAVLISVVVTALPELAHARPLHAAPMLVAGAPTTTLGAPSPAAAETVAPEPTTTSTSAPATTIATPETALPPAPPVTPPATAAPPAPAAPATSAYPVRQSSLTLVDTSRTTPARGSAAGLPTRTLPTLILTPLGAPGPLPVVVFAHGYDSEPQSYLPLLQTWAAAGYLVVAPESPGSAQNLPGTPVRTDIAGQAGDLTFLVTHLLQGAAGPVDPTRISVAGHSDGGSAVAILALNPTYHDSRIASYLVLSGAIPDGIGGPWGGVDEPGRLLVVVGSDDEYGNLPASTGVYATAAMAKTLVVANGGDHLDTYLGTAQLTEQVRAAILSFLGRGSVTPTAGSALTVSSAAR